MKFLILNTDYPEFLRSLYAQHPGLETKPYAEQMQARVGSLFGVADFYSSNLRKLGHEAWNIHANNEAMQRMWAREHGLKVPDLEWRFRWRRGFVPWVSRAQSQQWFYSILKAQIDHYRPDVVVNEAMNGVSTSFLREIKPQFKHLIGEHAATVLPETEDWSVYDLAISSFPPMVVWAREHGIQAELCRLGFEPRVLDRLKLNTTVFPISFVGSFHPVHSTRAEWLSILCKHFEVRVWAPHLDCLPNDSPIRSSYMGPAWGMEMYQILRNSKITLNHHGNVPPFANNMRLYEATGVGTLLLTDWKANLQEMFEPGREVAAYRSVEECIELIKHYLEHEEDRMTVAQAGQARTLRDHTYQNRMQQLVELVSRQL